ncbi:MAG: DctP family TRAP transporter solute-binding subunit [Rhodobacteraceae bacterium]|nr:DctP family TRAP transporter solute-binding subunit [Paracoccaceae bacterium]
MKDFGFVVATALAVTLSTSAVWGQETRTFDVSLPLGPESHHAIGILSFGQELERLSEGRLTIRPHYNNALGAEREVVEGMGFGLIDMGITSTGPMGGFVDAFMLFDLPYIFTSHEHVHGFLDSEHGDMLAQRLEDEVGVKILGWMENGFRHNTNNVRALNSPADLAGIRHRTQESRVQVDTWSALGANASPMAWTEVFTALQQGVMDSQENPIPTIYDVRFYDVQKYLNLTKHVYSPAPIMMGGGLFNSLSEADQNIVLEAAAIAVPVQRAASLRMEAELIERLVELGMTLTEPDIGPFQAAVQPVIADWTPTVGSDLIDAAMNFEH